MSALKIGAKLFVFSVGILLLPRPIFIALRVSQSDMMTQMSSEDEKRLFDVGTENAGCEVAYKAAVISSSTLLRAGEIRQSRLRDLDLERRTIICSNKNGSVRHACYCSRFPADPASAYSRTGV